MKNLASLHDEKTKQVYMIKNIASLGYMIKNQASLHD